MAIGGQTRSLGQGCTTGHQNKSEAERKTACSTSCHRSLRNASSYKAGKCQSQVAATKATQPVTGCVSTWKPRRTPWDARKGPIHSRRIAGGRPRSRGIPGDPSRMSGGPMSMSRTCWAMCTCNESPAKASSGDAMAIQQLSRPATKATGRQGGNCWGMVRRRPVHPRRYTIAATTQRVSGHGSSVHDDKMARVASDMFRV